MTKILKEKSENFKKIFFKKIVYFKIIKLFILKYFNIEIMETHCFKYPSKMSFLRL